MCKKIVKTENELATEAGSIACKTWYNESCDEKKIPTNPFIELDDERTRAWYEGFIQADENKETICCGQCGSIADVWYMKLASDNPNYGNKGQRIWKYIVSCENCDVEQVTFITRREFWETYFGVKKR